MTYSITKGVDITTIEKIPENVLNNTEDLEVDFVVPRDLSKIAIDVST